MVICMESLKQHFFVKQIDDKLLFIAYLNAVLKMKHSQVQDATAVAIAMNV
jgi:hypothetical protein